MFRLPAESLNSTCIVFVIPRKLEYKISDFWPDNKRGIVKKHSDNRLFLNNKKIFKINFSVFISLALSFVNNKENHTDS